MNRPDVVQDLSSFRLPPGWRGRSPWVVQLWWIVQSTLFRCSPQFMYGWRRFLLRAFGAKIGKRVLLRPTASVTFPWKLSIGDYSWIGDEVVLYSLGEIRIGDNAVVSQRSYLCTGSHDFRELGFDIWAKPIVVEAQAWIASDVFVTPGVRIGEGAVIGARSTVFSDIPAFQVCAGSPAKPLFDRRKGRAGTDPDEQAESAPG